MTQYQLHSSSPISPIIPTESIYRPHLLLSLPPSYILFTKSSCSDLFLINYGTVGNTSQSQSQSQSQSESNLTISGATIKCLVIKELIRGGGIQFMDYVRVQGTNLSQSSKGAVYLIVGGMNAMVLLKLDLDQERVLDVLGLYKWMTPQEGFVGCFLKKAPSLESSSSHSILSVATAGSHGISIFEFDTTAPKNGFQKKQTLLDHRKNSFILSLKSAQYQNCLVSGNVEGLVSVWDLDTGRAFHQFGNDICSQPARSVDLIERVSKKPSGDEQILDTFVVTGSDDSYIRIYDFETGKLVRAMKHDHRGAYISSIKVSNSTKSLCSTTIDGSIHLYDISSLGQVHSSQFEQADFTGALSDCGTLWGCEFTTDDSSIYFAHDNGIAQMSS